MSAPATDTTQQSKRGRKKKANAEPPAPSTSTPVDADAGNGTADAATNGNDGAYESPYIKELYKYAKIVNLRYCLAETSISTETSAT